MLAPHKNFLESYGAGFVADSSGSFEFIAVDKKDWQKARELLFSAEAQFVQTNTGDVICYSLPTITLSRRNLLTLLSKLEQPNSARTLIKPGGTVVKVETDEQHYKGREPGRANDESEAFVRDLEAFLAVRKQLKG